jgi:hypothetical protein
MLNKKDLEALGVDVDAALARVKALDVDHHSRFPELDPKTGKKSVHVPLPVEKVWRVAVDAVNGHSAAIEKLAQDSLKAILVGSNETK